MTRKRVNNGSCVGFLTYALTINIRLLNWLFTINGILDAPRDYSSGNCARFARTSLPQTTFNESKEQEKLK